MIAFPTENLTMSWFTVFYNQVIELPSYTWSLLNSLCFGAWHGLSYYLSHTGEWLVFSFNTARHWISSSLNAITSWLGDACTKVIDSMRFCFDHTVKWLTIICTGLTDGVVYFFDCARNLITSRANDWWWWFLLAIALLLLAITFRQLNQRRDTLKAKLLSCYCYVVALFMFILKTKIKLCGCLFCEAWLS